MAAGELGNAYLHGAQFERFKSRLEQELNADAFVGAVARSASNIEKPASITLAELNKHVLMMEEIMRRSPFQLSTMMPKDYPHLVKVDGKYYFGLHLWKQFNEALAVDQSGAIALLLSLKALDLDAAFKLYQKGRGQVVSNARNDGRSFEGLIEKTADAYFNARILRLCKVEPPVRVIGWGKNRQVIFLENPFPDWTGTWTERAGRSLMLEPKSTIQPKLPLAKSGKLSEKQVEWLKRWHYAGAAVGIIWEWVNQGCVFIPIGQAVEIWKSGRRHIKFEECDPIKQGRGFVLIDFVENLRKWYP